MVTYQRGSKHTEKGRGGAGLRCRYTDCLSVFRKQPQIKSILFRQSYQKHLNFRSSPLHCIDRLGRIEAKRSGNNFTNINHRFIHTLNISRPSQSSRKSSACEA